MGRWRKLTGRARVGGAALGALVVLLITVTGSALAASLPSFDAQALVQWG